MPQTLENLAKQLVITGHSPAVKVAKRLHKGGPQISFIATGPISKQPMTQAYRHVVVLIGNDKLALLTQYFPEFTTDNQDTGESHFSEGTYGTLDDLPKIIAAFGEKVARHADYLGSLNRLAA